MVTCDGCKWCDAWTGVCCNGESEHCADAWDNGCEHYERWDDDGRKEI